MHFSWFIFIVVILQNGPVTETVMIPIRLSNISTSNLAKGNCSKTVSFIDKIEVPYLETYQQNAWGGLFYKIRTRWNYRLEFTKSWRTEYYCCDGYRVRYNLTGNPFKRFTLEKTCDPICDPDCGNGTCVEPNVCSCHDGYVNINHDSVFFVKTDVHGNSACVPLCTHSCKNGRCIAPEVCGCNNGYQLSDYDPHTCNPVCSSECGVIPGSYCKEPGQCLCMDGWYKSNSSDDCIPICSRSCVNGTCVAPEFCHCDEGYKLDPHNQFTCKPVCKDNCEYGKCTGPNVCTCDYGYKPLSPSICEPICSKNCVNGGCIAPETCSCYPGYGLLNNKYVCEPVCNMSCVNGQCTSPGVCTCDDGFQLTGDETEQHICKPRCDMPCEPFGKCTAPNVCVCEKGFRLADKTVNRTGSNSSSGELAWDSAAESSVCKPICEPNCQNGFCAGPNSCICNPGYHNFNYSNLCEPICNFECVNGYCNAPNSCACHPGYQPSNLTSICKPICDPSCENGVCEQPNVCSCNSGYRASTRLGANMCEPVCEPICETIGICEAPNLCVCKPGYRAVHENGSDILLKCEPVCDADCDPGNCVAPGICACSRGYQKIKTGKCEPICYIECGNGTCVAPETCKCDSGFVLSPLSVTENTTRGRCVPSCEGCENGECEAPGECRCHVGFAKIEGTCVQLCQGGCGAHGACIKERGTCECEYGWTGPHCDQPTLCVLILNGNYTDQLTIIEEQNATIKHIFTNNPTCSECVSKVSKVTNETLCFQMAVNDSKTETQIGCLMNKECLALSSQYKDQGEIIKTTSGIVAGVLLLMAIIYLTFLILHKRQSRQANLDIIRTAYRDSRTSMQGLIESDANNSLLT